MTPVERCRRKTLGLGWEANDFFNFIADVADAAGGDLQRCTASAERQLSEATWTTCPATRALGRRVGNAAYSQRQHDMWGAVVAAIDAYAVVTAASRIAVADCADKVECALEHCVSRPGSGGPLESAALHFKSRLLDGRRRPTRGR